MNRSHTQVISFQDRVSDLFPILLPYHEQLFPYRIVEELPTILPRLLRTPFLARGRQLSGNPTSRALT
jgi:hypothetical protein